MRLIHPTLPDAYPVRARMGNARPITRGRVLNWLRAAHLWIGLWGAMLGLMFGVTGLLMNHRSVLKIPVEKAEITRTQVSIPSSFENSAQLTTWLRGRFALPDARATARRETPMRVRFMGQSVERVELWSV